MYRIGYPFWKSLARANVPLKLRVNVIYDDEAKVFVATSNDLVGLIAEAENMDDLVKEVTSSVQELLLEILHVPSTPNPVTDLRLCMA